MSLPAYYYAKPRTDYITVTDTEARKAAGSWSFVPATLYEWVCVGMGCLTAASSVPKYGLPKPLYKSSWKLLPAYAASLWFARWSDRVTVRGYKYEDKVVDDYMRLYPEKFPEYVPKKMIETFSDWTPMRSGSQKTHTEVMSKWRIQDTEHYIPSTSHKP